MVGEARDPETTEGPLEGITVVDASQVLVGPFCTMQLGDLGADVIKIERPGVGDQTRGWHPPQFDDESGTHGVSAYYASVNRNKRSITLDLKSTEGRKILETLVAEADVFVENFRVGTLDEWGLGYQDLSSINENLIYCSLSGYGEWGPYADKPAYDLIMQAEGGLMSITGEENGIPVRVGVAVADIGAGMYATQAILAALFRRELSDEGGQKIDVSLFDGQLAWMSYMASYYFATGQSPGRMGSKHPTIAPYQAFPTNDGYVVVAAASEKLWQNLCRALKRPDLLEEDGFKRNTDRVENHEELEQILSAEFNEYETDQIVSILEEADVPARKVHDIEDAFSHPQTIARGMRTSVEHPFVGEMEMAASPMHFSESVTSVRRHPPGLGEHTTEILSDIGYTDQEIDELEDQHVI